MKRENILLCIAVANIALAMVGGFGLCTENPLVMAALLPVMILGVVNFTICLKYRQLIEKGGGNDD